MLIFDVPEKTRIVFCPMIQICLKSEKNAKSGLKKKYLKKKLEQTQLEIYAKYWSACDVKT